MLPDRSRLTHLFHQYLENRISPGELKELFRYIREAEQDDLLQDEIVQVFRQIQPGKGSGQVDWETMFSKIVRLPEKAAYRPVRKTRRLWRNAAAVFLLLIAGSGVFLHFHHRSPDVATREVTDPGNGETDIMPGGNRAVLILADGGQVQLDSINNGKLASQGSISVIKAGSGSLTYRPEADGTREQEGAQNKPGSTAYNELVTPRGGQYQLTLSDGTKIWLNAASSIRYPVAFSGRERNVEVTGEVYFEVAHDAKRPFTVRVGNEIIEDLGTRFNVNAYPDEPAMRMTLLQGGIRMRNIILRPGEQAIITKSGRMTVKETADANKAIAWKNGFFAFDNASLETVMRKLSRWYDIDVVYEPGVNNDQRFSGRIDRGLALTQVLNGLKQTKAHFRIEASRKVVILP